MKVKKAKSLDVFDHACKFAQENNGCVKFFNESHDRDFMSRRDYLVNLDKSTQLGDYEELNDMKSVSVMDRNDAKSLFKQELSAFDE